MREAKASSISICGGLARSVSSNRQRGSRRFRARDSDWPIESPSGQVIVYAMHSSRVIGETCSKAGPLVERDHERRGAVVVHDVQTVPMERRPSSGADLHNRVERAGLIAPRLRPIEVQGRHEPHASELDVQQIAFGEGRLRGVADLEVPGEPWHLRSQSTAPVSRSML